MENLWVIEDAGGGGGDEVPGGGGGEFQYNSCIGAVKGLTGIDVVWDRV